ncbi:DUF916 and DUF3324 domain-containing protein [Vagococcus carniphilus]|uniref:DUF916 and DUF3324 domain-containing protein n=1 Tax=Vagococcus carniphilus TaxID=218144 RepID=UPI003BA8B38C
MKQNKFSYYVGIIFLVTFSLISVTTQIAQAEETSGMTFNMESVISEKQWEKGTSSSYFDLLMKPGEETQLKVVVSNDSEQAQKINVFPADAYTSQTGLIDYTTDQKKLDKSLKYPMTTLVSKAQLIELQPKESKEVVFDLKSPEESIAGIIVGAIVAEGVDNQDATSKKVQGVSIVNKFQIVKPIILRQNELIIKTDLKLNKVAFTSVGSQPAVTANISNVTPTKFGDLSLEAKIRKNKQDKVLKSQKVKDLEMAPNSNFDFPIYLEDANLEAGDYELELVARTNGESWTFKEPFKVTSEQSKELSQAVAEKPKEEVKQKKPIGLIIFVVVVIIGTILGVGYWYWKKK